MMDLQQLFAWVERLRKETLGEPKWVNEKQVFEYKNQSVEAVAVLKLCRAAHGVSALGLLCRAGLFIDLGVIARCVGDCADEIFFLLENYPKTSKDVDQFIKSFFEHTIDKDLLLGSTPSVPTKKIRAAVVRVLKGQHDSEVRDMMETIYRTFSGYVHANYAHIMEMYNGTSHDFCLSGVPSIEQRRMRMAQLEVAADSVLHATGFIALKLGRDSLFREIVESSTAAPAPGRAS